MSANADGTDRTNGTRPDLSYEAFRAFIGTRPAEVVANILTCLLHQTNYLLDRQLQRLEQDFLKEGGLRERMTLPSSPRARTRRRNVESLSFVAEVSSAKSP